MVIRPACARNLASLLPWCVVECRYSSYCKLFATVHAFGIWKAGEKGKDIRSTLFQMVSKKDENIINYKVIIVRGGNIIILL